MHICKSMHAMRTKKLGNDFSSFVALWIIGTIRGFCKLVKIKFNQEGKFDLNITFSLSHDGCFDFSWLREEGHVEIFRFIIISKSEAIYSMHVRNLITSSILIK